jgi:cytochrome c oxidase cbb3-type subunit III
MAWPGRLRSRRAAHVLIAVAATVCTAQQQNDARSEHGRQFLGLAPPPDAVAATRGQKLFVQNCGFCHGPNATGAQGPDLLRSTVVLHDEKGETIGPVLLKGRPDKGMPSFAALTPDQIFDISEFLHLRVEQTANRWGYKLQNIVTGNAVAGEAFFGSHCIPCHSPVGDLAHIATKFEPADLQARFLYPDGATERVRVTLLSGEVITGTLKRMDDFTISIWDSGGAYRSWPLDAVKAQIDDPLKVHRELLSKYTDQDMHNVLAYLETLK